MKAYVSDCNVSEKCKGDPRMKRTLAAPGDELAAVLDELARHFEEFLGLVHCECVWVCVVACFGWIGERDR